MALKSLIVALSLAHSSLERLIFVCFRSLNSPRGPHLLSPLSFSFPGSVFVSLCLNFAHLSALMEGDIWRAPFLRCTRSESDGRTPGRRRNAIRRNIRQARLDEGYSSKAGGVCRVGRKKRYNLEQQTDTYVVKSPASVKQMSGLWILSEILIQF